MIDCSQGQISDEQFKHLARTFIREERASGKSGSIAAQHVSSHYGVKPASQDDAGELGYDALPEVEQEFAILQAAYENGGKLCTDGGPMVIAGASPTGAERFHCHADALQRLIDLGWIAGSKRQGVVRVYKLSPECRRILTALHADASATASAKPQIGF